MKIDYYQSADGIHIFEFNRTDNQQFDVHSVIGELTQIYQNSQGKAAYIVLNLQAYYRLPLREFVAELKQVYKMVDESPLMIALVLQPALVNVVETMVKTTITRDAIQNFTKLDLALLWLNIERKKQQARHS